MTNIASVLRLVAEESGSFRMDASGPRSRAEAIRDLATASHKAKPPGSPYLLRRFRDNARRLAVVHRNLVEASAARVPMPAESEWLLDNYYVVEEVVREVRTDLPRNYYRELPAIDVGRGIALPRIYPLAALVLAHGDSALTEEEIRAALATFQESVPLTTGELWAIPAMLRLSLLETLRRLGDEILTTLEHAGHAREAGKAIRAGARPTLDDECSDAFAVAMWHELHDHDAGHGPTTDHVTGWASRRLADFPEIRNREFCRQAANQVSIGNAITSIRLLAVIDWAVLFEATSLVESRLRTDPGGVYARQDFGTRDRSRRIVERLARGSQATEIEVAEQALAAASRHAGDPVRGHVVWYLLGDGVRDLQRDLHYRSPWRDLIRTSIERVPTVVYFGLLGILFASLMAVGIAYAGLGTSVGLLVILVLALAAPASESAISLGNFLLSRLVPPRILPKLDYRGPLPADAAAFVVIPTILSRPEQAKGLLERLEQHSLANPDSRLRFALLTDFVDAAAETMPNDDAIVAALLDGVRKLNESYRVKDRFFVFHRRRQFNPSQGCWMGWERKRGKLHEFNKLLRGAADTSYAWKSQELAGLPSIRYVLTLDTDTVMPRDSARSMLATFMHPLNRPRLSEDRRRVVAGYGVLQPRVSFLYQTGFESWFAQLFAGSAGIDPYSAAVSDTYMDLFGRGTFTGKGLYDVDAFEATAGQAFPENRILSHDLIESNFARCALATEVEVFDEFPARYAAYARREHRWIRGDWQLLPWLMPKVPVPGGRAANVLPLLERWKIVDNLRRSKVSIGVVVLLILGWTVLPGAPLVWTLLGLLPYLLPTLLFVLETSLNALRGTPVRSLLARSRVDLRSSVGQALLLVAFLPYQAILAVDAIVRTLYRIFVSHRHMLEWETAAAADRRLGNDVASLTRLMAPACIVAVLGAVAVVWAEPWSLLVAGPILLAWLISPLIAYLVSLPRKFPEPVLTADERRALRLLARRTWDFFDAFVVAEDNWLPPDNFQEAPRGEVAHRTSPTNIGLYLVSCLAARDFGYVTTRTMATRIKNTFDTLDQLERHQGHWLNWYDTQSLAPLPPAYVSTVDSGNLLACLFVVKQGLLGHLAAPLDEPLPIEGIADTFRLARLAWDRHRESHPGPADGDADRLVAELDALLAKPSLDAVAVTRLIDLAQLWQAAVRDADGDADAHRLVDSLARLTASLRGVDTDNAELADQMRELVDRAGRHAAEMDFRFLYSVDRELFSIGYNVATGRLDGSHYDLLASEACIASFLAVSRGQVPRKHWFRLGRLVTHVAGETGLVSWGGTMFEYLMPRILLPVPRGVLLDQAQRSAVARQIEYAGQVGLPWGVSESGFYHLDAAQWYQYQSFGVLGLGLKRGLERDRVIAPYATVMAVDVDPHAALANLERLRKLGGEGPFGFYEAIDFSERAAPEKFAIVRSYMAHHQGMGFLSIANRLFGGILRRRLWAEPAVRATSLILEERIPYDVPLLPPPATESAGQPTVLLDVPTRRRITTPNTAIPRTHLLSNGNYTVLVTNAGGGFSRTVDADVTRWAADRTADASGMFFYLRDRNRGTVWSAGYQPTRKLPETYEAIFSLDKTEITRRDDGIESLLETIVVPDQDVEIRRLSLTNLESRPRDLDVTSYVELVMQAHAADLAHPAFGKLFLETEWLASHSTLLCRRRPRTPEQKPTFAFHLLVTDASPGVLTYETDRARFLGRRRSTADPEALAAEVVGLAGTTGPVLDPIFALRRQTMIKPGEKVTLSFITGVAPTREVALAVADQYHGVNAVPRAFDLAWARARIESQPLRGEDTHLFQRLATHLLYPVGPLRAKAEILAKNRRGQQALWSFGISGDLPIALLRVHGSGGMGHVRQLVQAWTFWRQKGLRADLVLLLENAGGYSDALQQEIVGYLQGIGLAERIDHAAGIFVRKGWQMVDEDRTLLLSAARVVVSDGDGPLASQCDAIPATRPAAPAAPATQRRIPTEPFVYANDRPGDLRFDNGHGGFSADGTEYVIAPGSSAPAAPPSPWSNVIASPSAGMLVTDSGSGFAWVGNSQSNRLTPWSNDPVCDPPGEVLYVQDEATGALWCPTPLPIAGGERNVTVRHGQGYSRFERTVDGIEHELTLFVPVEGPLKVSVLRLKNTGRKPRRLQVVYYVEWVLGTVRETTSPYVVTEIDAETGAVFARNAWNPDFAEHVAFADIGLRPRSITCDRTEFLGRNGRLAAPMSFGRVALSGQVGAGLDPCAALRGSVALAGGEERTIVCVLGEAADVATARTLIKNHLPAAAAETALRATIERWDRITGTVQVKTPDPALDLLLNRWLLYQTLSCRYWGRSAFQQSGGAFGFRDQLQDVLALVHAMPDETRRHLLRAASRQFPEGDVQHWWHEPSGMGVRTRFSDDFLWLPFAAAHYIETTGDAAVLDEKVSFLSAAPLGPHEEERYAPVTISEESATLYEHCRRALHHGWQLGSHGLPLMGIGDWNDGMNRVGSGGKGESIWVAWFQIVCLTRFARLAELRQDAGTAQECRDRAEQLRHAIEAHGYDGNWYLRAYFDDGTPLGSSRNDECRIDSIVQSWAVISGVADKERAERAMNEVSRQLIERDRRLLLLFTPPFDQGPLQPGYIKGYLPGIRENGGQYTHAATWVVKALAALGRADDAYAAYSCLNPVLGTTSPDAVSRYRGEPYVVAADVYSMPPHVGRAGWTWYTGSSSWLYRVGIEDLLGLRREGNLLRIEPCVPAAWPSFEIRYRFGKTEYRITVTNGPRGSGRTVTADGIMLSDPIIHLVDDGGAHTIVIGVAGTEPAKKPRSA